MSRTETYRLITEAQGEINASPCRGERFHAAHRVVGEAYKLYRSAFVLDGAEAWSRYAEAADRARTALALLNV